MVRCHESAGASTRRAADGERASSGHKLVFSLSNRSGPGQRASRKAVILVIWLEAGVGRGGAGCMRRWCSSSSSHRGEPCQWRRFMMDAGLPLDTLFPEAAG